MRKKDFTIVGAGFVGLSTAYWLSFLAPGSKILVVDRERSGAGASGKNAGFLTKGSASFYRHLITNWGEEKALQIFQFAETSLSLLHDHILLPAMIPHLRTDSLSLYRKSAPFLPEAFGFAGASAPLPEIFSGALRNPGEFKCAPLDLIAGLEALLRERGVEFEFGQREAGSAAPGKTIFCLNAYTARVLPEFKERIFPRRAQMLRVRLRTQPTLGEDLFYDPEERVYFRREGKEHLLIGGKRLVDPIAEETFTEEISPPIQSALEDYLKDDLKLSFEVVDRWSGIMGFTADELPILERQGERVFLAGFSGHGMGFGFHAGKKAAEMSLETGPVKGLF